MERVFGIFMAVMLSAMLLTATFNVRQTWAEPLGWSQTYGGIGSDSAYALVQTSDGGYALAGSTDSYGAGSDDFWLVKTDANGTKLWDKIYGRTIFDFEYAYALVQTGDGGYAVAGDTYSHGTPDSHDFWLVKTDANGTKLWDKTYGGTNSDLAYALLQTDDGGYALAGYTYSFGAGSDDMWLVKTDANGNTLWNRAYGGTDSDSAFALLRTDDGGYALAGGTASFGAGSDDVWLIKTSLSLIEGDINVDGTVDIFDIVIVALEFGHPPPPIIDTRADVNKDGVVDIFDIVVVAAHFGAHA